MEEKQFVLTEGGLSVFCCQTEPVGQIQRIVLGVHGLGGSTRDTIQEGIAEEMDLFGSVTVRFDFPSHGQSPMDEEAFTLPNCLESLKLVARHISECYPDVEDLCIFASGFGAYVTLLAMDELIDLPQTIKLVAQTPIVLMHETLLAMKRISAPTLEAMGSARFEKLARPFSVTYQFYLDAMAEPALNAYPIPILILQGEEDAYIRSDHIKQLRQLNERAKLVTIPGASHRFLEEGAWDMVLDLTRDWFEFEQVLCCDWE